MSDRVFICDIQPEISLAGKARRVGGNAAPRAGVPASAVWLSKSRLMSAEG